MTDKATHLDGEYAAFGKVIDGMDVVDQIVQAERDEMDKPVEDQKIKTVTVDKKGKYISRTKEEISIYKMFISLRLSTFI